MLVFDLRLPQQPLTWLMFLVSVVLAVIVSFAVRFILNLAAFWLLDYRGVGALASAIWTFLSGFVVPLAFFPPVLKAVARALPFAGFVQYPVEVFLEQHQGADLAALLLLQLGWAVALLAAGRWVLAAATRKVVIQGG
jgi:ABC-2 type transport system permease protein